MEAHELGWVDCVTLQEHVHRTNKATGLFSHVRTSVFVHMYPKCRSIVYEVVDETYLSFVQAKDVSVLKVFLGESLDTGGCIQYCNS